MVAFNLPEKTVRNLLEYTNEFIDNACSQKFIREAEEDKNRIKRALKRGREKVHTVHNFRLKDMVS